MSVRVHGPAHMAAIARIFVPIMTDTLLPVAVIQVRTLAMIQVRKLARTNGHPFTHTRLWDRLRRDTSHLLYIHPPVHPRIPTCTDRPPSLPPHPSTAGLVESVIDLAVFISVPHVDRSRTAG